MNEPKEKEIIDVWTQPASRSMLQNVPEITRLFRRSGSGNVLEKGIEPEEIIELMDAAGIAKILLSAWHRPGSWVISNDEVARISRLCPERISGVAAVDLENPVAAVKELTRAVRDLGFVALRVIPWLWNRPPNDRFYFPLYVKGIELKIPFCTQVGHTGPLRASDVGRPIPYIDEIALIFPDLKIVCGHIGYPWTNEMIALAWKYPNVYIDTSAYLPGAYPRELVDFLKGHGRKKVLFGSNFPMLQFQQCVSQLDILGLNAGIKKKFLTDNAKKVFAFL